jgi:hypothetical protein
MDLKSVVADKERKMSKARLVVIALFLGLGLLGLLVSALGTFGIVVRPSFQGLFLPSFFAVLAAGAIADWQRFTRTFGRRTARK